MKPTRDDIEEFCTCFAAAVLMEILLAALHAVEGWKNLTACGVGLVGSTGAMFLINRAMNKKAFKKSNWYVVIKVIGYLGISMLLVLMTHFILK